MTPSTRPEQQAGGEQIGHNAMKKDCGIVTQGGMPMADMGLGGGGIPMPGGSGGGDDWQRLRVVDHAQQQMHMHPHAQQQLFSIPGGPQQGSGQGGRPGGSFVGSGIHPGAYFNQTQIGAMVSGMMGGMPHMHGGGMNQMGPMGGFAPMMGATAAFAPPGQANAKRAGDFPHGQDGGDTKGRKAPKRSLAATVERMEKHKILERRRRERTKELVAELMSLVPGIECIGDSPTMNSVLEEAIVYLKDAQWEGEQRSKHPCTCGAPGVGSNPMPQRRREINERTASGGPSSRSDPDAPIEEAGGHMQHF
mmetsp:Transcript_17610/g.34483  ORF Transcript_17610/g.34483 Transcript_17610/m.34483 type:complete len:307 (-) Transcript_17610:186-1106(-)|eukprot:CAMPEP_0173388232 /NCGR_PEP_ID=MMETSP1356-20130122/10595_1 /TAXON_ID=77927 ORGANISM="Hemiselmis virescens, Strain PCC157" /NCGR_SAMPLE_ID=MMETSP1356 /ASSEMBLY_ACC=CAM_ASM_000847 /LENGTH=306 /DNA_ID=CAMNT_0014345091 /DNA_START=70 /DNA_END=990 /DNA_ORIENTATION=-